MMTTRSDSRKIAVVRLNAALARFSIARLGCLHELI
jgi:hypothetical protein